MGSQKCLLQKFGQGSNWLAPAELALEAAAQDPASETGGEAEGAPLSLRPLSCRTMSGSRVQVRPEPARSGSTF